MDRDGPGRRAAEQAFAAVRRGRLPGRGIPVTVTAVGPSDDGTPMAELWAADAVLVRPDQHVAWRGSSAEAAAAALAIAAGWGATESFEQLEEGTNVGAVVS